MEECRKPRNPSRCGGWMIDYVQIQASGNDQFVDCMHVGAILRQYHLCVWSLSLRLVVIASHTLQRK